MTLPPLGEGRPLRLLFLCTHNSARSQVAEAVARHLGNGKVEAFSAGTHPSRVHPDAIAVLQGHGIETEGLRSKSLAEFQQGGFDYVITVCDHARDVCPVFPGAEAQLHWSFPDPSAHADTVARKHAFGEVYNGMVLKISDLLQRVRE